MVKNFKLNMSHKPKQKKNFLKIIMDATQIKKC